MYKHPRQEIEAYSLPANSVGKRRYVPVHNSRKRYCTPESSSPDSPAYDVLSNATALVSHNNSAYEDTSGSCVTDDFNDKIKELETVMMGPDSLDLVLDYNDSFDSTSCQETNTWRSTLEAVSRRDLRADLVSCAKAMSENDLMMARSMMEKLRLMVSVSALSANAREFRITARPGSDITGELSKLFKEACQCVDKSTVLIPKGEFKLGEIEMMGPCKAPIIFVLQGTVRADGNVNGKDFWVAFRRITNFRLNGGGIFDGEGNASWRANNCHKTSLTQCKRLPISIRFDYITDGKVRDITSLDAKNFHINVIGAKNLTFEDIRIVAPEESPNTDGIHVGRSDGIKIINTNIKTGDDCISVGDGMKNLLVERVSCGPGHGISIGSLGLYGHEEDVTGVKVVNCTLRNTDNGVRIKTWPSAACSTTASGIHFENIILHNVSNPILIDQEYCPWNRCNKNKPSSIKLVDIKFKNIKGSSGNKDAVKLLCSKGFPCKNVEIGDIDITYNGKDGPATFQCSNVSPKLVGKQCPKACSSPVTKLPGH